MAGPVEGLLYLAARKFEYHIEQTLEDEDKHKYEEFKQLMLRFKSKSIGFRALRDEIIKLFEAYPNLAAEFITFFPEHDLGYNLFVTQTLNVMESALEDYWMVLERCKAGRMDVRESMDGLGSILKDHQEWMSELRNFVPLEAIVYGDSVKVHFAGRNQGDRYDEFVRLLHELQARSGEFSDVRLNFIELFQNDPALIRGFNQFLPENERILLTGIRGRGEFQVAQQKVDARAGEEEEDLRTMSQLSSQEPSLEVTPSGESSTASNSIGWHDGDETDSLIRHRVP
ncbi:hypothetical protein R1flu_003531 [Riccia fluitans]|uniref:Uncharacterized protein n=1 Tax=Riccia fluitans TaxID=41844 RepID=A0ABD1Y9M4_9MARC